MVVSFGYLILRQVLQLIVLSLRGDRAKEIEILVLRHQVAVLLDEGFLGLRVPGGDGAAAVQFRVELGRRAACRGWRSTARRRR
jgi:hypothetical protein